MDEYKTIYARWLAIELRKLNYHIVKIEPNPYKLELDSYVFRCDPGFYDDMKRLTEEHKAGQL